MFVINNAFCSYVPLLFELVKVLILLNDMGDFCKTCRIILASLEYFLLSLNMHEWKLDTHVYNIEPHSCSQSLFCPCPYYFLLCLSSACATGIGAYRL
jgi:hypothetical protein